MNDRPEFEHVLYEVSERIATITLNRPEVLNACDPTTHAEVQRSIELAESDDDVRVIIIAGAGRAFCSGSDLRIVGKLTGVAARRYINLDFSTKNCVATCGKPVIAALHGHVAGGGFELALACDIRLVADNVLFSLPEILLGTIPGSGGLQRLPQIVGMGIAKEWAFTGRKVDAHEAHRTGLANHVYALDRLGAEARAFAKLLTERTSLSLALAKVALDPDPPAADGMVGVYHMLASQACHDDPTYAEQASKYGRATKKNGR